jgi:asparagine synthase (glutamine-hydrolysing)
MCGIAGVFKPHGPFDADDARRRLEKAVDAIAYRGPDARAVAVWPERGLGFGHRRLSILDLSDRANQPMFSADRSAVISYNGEIYNFRELRGDLEREGARFSTTSDTEVILEGYLRWGLDKLLARAAGMYAFALHDGRTGKLYLVRDRPGKKPLFYAERGGKTVFCSEIAGLFALWDGPREISKPGLESYLSLKFTPAPLTPFERVLKIPAAHYLEISESGSRLVRYWTPLGKGIRGDDALDAVDAALTKAAERRLVSDVPVAAFLSGGIDSSLVVDRLNAAGARRTATYTIGYSDMPGYSEFEFSRLIAHKYPIDYREVRVDAKQTIEALQDERLVFGEPVSDWVWVPLHFLSRRARADGNKVVVLGEGSDELFFGYDVMAKALKQIESFAKPSRRAFAKLAYPVGRALLDAVPRGHRRLELWRRSARDLPLYWGSSIGFPATQRHQLAGPALGPTEGDPAGEFIAGLWRDYAENAADPADMANLICWIEFNTKMVEVLLKRVDRVTMLHSLEARAPFLDHELCELAFSIPGSVKFKQGRLKALLKDVARRHIPAEIVDRPKMGFSFPFKDWLRGPLGPVVESAFENGKIFRDHWVSRRFCRELLREHRAGFVDHAPRLWALYSLTRWYDRWIG